MAQINKLTPVNAPPAIGDLFPFWSQQNGRACSTSIYQLAQIIKTLIDTGGSAGIIPENGPVPIKISAFADAEFPINPGGTVTGLLSGFNRNYTQLQLLSGKDSTDVGIPGTSVFGKAGAGPNGDRETGGLGGNWTASGGDGVALAGSGIITGGSGVFGGEGGAGIVTGGSGTGGGGGSGFLTGGDDGGDGNGGGAIIKSGRSGGTGAAGNVFITANSSSGSVTNGSVIILMNEVTDGTLGKLIVLGMQTTDPHEAGALWANGAAVNISAG